MIKIHMIVFTFFIIISFGFFIVFSKYLYIQYEEATMKFYKQKSTYKKYCMVKKSNAILSQIKNNATQIIDKETIKKIQNYIIIEFIDKDGAISKTQTIYNNQLTIHK